MVSYIIYSVVNVSVGYIKTKRKTSRFILSIYYINIYINFSFVVVDNKQKKNEILNVLVYFLLLLLLNNQDNLLL